jgi:hypothetical protein
VAEKQKSLFEDDLPEWPKATGLVVISQPGRPLTKAQRAFNRLVTKVEELRAAREREIKRLDQALTYYAEQIHPRLKRGNDLRKEMVRVLAPFLNGSRLKRNTERRTLRIFLADQLDEITGVDGSLNEEDLQAVFKKVHGVEFAQAEQEGVEGVRSVMEQMFGQLGIDIDLSGFRPDMSDEEMAAKAAEMAEKIHQQEEEEDRAFRPRARRGKSKRQLEREERARQAEQLRNKSIASIFKQLAKVLHPDLEPDAGRKQAKSTLMQELTAAYRNNDLHTLLRLELEWIQREEGDVERLTEEKLSIYNQVLKEQVAELEREIAELPLHPRYQPIVAMDGPFGLRVQTADPEEVRWMDDEIAEMEASIARMRSSEGLDEIREVLKMYRASNRDRC